jgi:DNA-directed RNA polymerase
MKLKVGGWAINMLTSLPIFGTDEKGVLTLTLTEEQVESLGALFMTAVKHSPFIMPPTEPPEPWTGLWEGGLPTGHWARVPLVDRRASQLEVQRAIKRGSMWMALDAINAVQGIAYCINLPVLDVAMKMQPPVPDWPLDEKYKKSAHQLAKKSKRVQRWLKAKHKADAYAFDMLMAEALACRECFYFPQDLDFRGRMYGLPFFNYQRGDHARGLLLFARGKPIGDSLPWLMAHVAGQSDGWLDKDDKPSRLNFRAARCVGG